MRKTLKPREGRLARDPVSKIPLPPEGRSVEMTSYWLRRLASGDVVEVTPPAVPAEPQPTTAEEIQEDTDGQLQSDPE